MSARVLVTGATGFIGARLAARLASSGREVRCLVRDRGGTRARELERDGFDLHEGDVLRPETLRGAGAGRGRGVLPDPLDGSRRPEGLRR